MNHRWDEQYRQLELLYRRLQDDNLRMQKELESTIYNLKARVAELEQNGKVASLNPKQENYNLSQFDDVKARLLQLQVFNHHQCNDYGLSLVDLGIFILINHHFIWYIYDKPPLLFLPFTFQGDKPQFL